MRQFLAVCLLGLQSFVAAGAAPVDPAPDLSMLADSSGDAEPAIVTGGALDGQFGPFDYKAARRRGGPFWILQQAGDGAAANGAMPSLGVGKGRHLALQVYTLQGFCDAMRLTCSIGVATSDTLGVWGEHFVARADAAVYAAKNSGRNQVHVALPVAA